MMVAQPTSGGTARHLLEIANGCFARGFEVHVAYDVRHGDPFRRAIAALRDRGVEMLPLQMEREISPLRDARAAVRLREAIVARSPDVLHLHSSKAGALGRAAVVGMRGRPAVVYTPHAYAFLTQSGVLRRWCYHRIERGLARWTDRLLAVSDSEARVASQLGIAGRISIARNGVSDAPIASRAREQRRLRIGWLGRLTWQKRPDAAVATSLVLTKLGVDHDLLLGGNGPELERVRASIAELDTESYMQVLGFVEDPSGFHDGIDLLLITSRAEGLPYVGLDAMARGVPIVGYDVPGVRDLVEHGATGLLAPDGDPGALAAQLARLARDLPLRYAMGERARRRARERFRLHHQIEEICEVYRALAARTHERAA